MRSSADFALDATIDAAVASLCRRLDGLPLAIELAAAQADVLGPAQIERRLGDAAVLRSSQRGGVSRHRSLDSVLDWSYDLLDETDRLVLDRISVFRGASSLEAIEAVVADARVAATEVLEVLARLVRRSLVVAIGAGADRRYRLLETIREHSQRRLARAGALDTWRNRHLDWVLTLAAEAAVGVSGGEQRGQAHWFMVLDDDLDNLEEALAWSSLDALRAERALPAVIGLFNYWIARGTRRAQGVRWCSTLADAATAMEPSTRAVAYLNACFLATMSDLAAGEALAASVERLADRTGDERTSATAAVASGIVAVLKGDVDAVRAHAARRPDVLDGFARILADHNVGWLRSLEGAYDEAYGLLMNVVDEFAALGDEHLSYGFGTTGADAGAAAGLDTEPLRVYCRDALGFAIRFPCVSCEAVALASLVLVDGCEDLGGRVAAARRAVTLAHGIRETFHVMIDLGVLVGALAAAGDVERAAYLAGGIHALRERTRYDHCLPGRRCSLETGIDVARAALGAGEFDRLFAEGRQLEYGELVAAAIEEQETR